MVFPYENYGKSWDLPATFDHQSYIGRFMETGWNSYFQDGWIVDAILLPTTVPPIHSSIGGIDVKTLTMDDSKVRCIDENYRIYLLGGSSHLVSGL